MACPYDIVGDCVGTTRFALWEGWSVGGGVEGVVYDGGFGGTYG